MSKQSQNAKKKTKTSAEKGPSMFAMGYVDLIFEIKLTEKDLEKPPQGENQNTENKGKEEDKYYKIEELNSIADLKFLKDKKEIWNKIILSGGNDTIKQLIVGNKTAKKKCVIDYNGFGRPKFEGNEEFFKEIYDHVTSKNHLVINETPLDDGCRSSLSIILSYNGQKKTIFSGKSQEEEDKEKNKNKKTKKKESKTKKNEKKEEKKDDKKEEKKDDVEEEEEEEEDDDEDEDDEEDENEEEKKDDYEETEAMKAKKIPKFKRSTSVLTKLNPSFAKYDMVYFNYVDLKNVPGDFKMRDLIELLKFFKQKGSTIFVNYYKPKKPKIPEEKPEEETHENDNEIMGEGKTKEKKEGEENVEENKEEKKEEKKKKKKEGPPRKMLDLNQLYELTNIFFFDIKQCKKLFNKHYETFTEDNKNNRKNINRSKIFDYFIKGIATATKEEVQGMKTGLFMDKLDKLTIIFASKKAANKIELDSQPYPKINHTNMDLIKEYQKILKTNKKDYYANLISSIAVNCAASGANCQTIEIIYPAFLIALEIIKKKLECEKNNLPQDESIYKVKVNEKVLFQDLQKFASGGKEDGFVLDCTNKEKSAMKDYVSLYDYHLKSFFSSEYIRKDLKSKGFINTKGFVMYDPIYRNVMGVKVDKKKKKVTEEEMKTKLMTSIQGINVSSNIKDKEIDTQKVAQIQNLSTEKKLPFNKELGTSPTNKRKHKKKKKNGKLETSAGASDDSANNSGNESGEESGKENAEETQQKV